MNNFMIYNEQSNEDRRIRRTKYFIQMALLELLEEKQIQEISISELTKKADVNRKTFYNHYSTPEDVLKELEENLVDKLFSYLDADKDALLSNPRNAFLHFVNELMDNYNFSKLLVHSGEIKYLLEKMRNYFIPYMSELISKHYEVKQKYLPFLIDYAVGGVLMVLENWLFHTDSLSPEELADVMSSMVSATLSTLSPKKPQQQ